MKSLISNTLIVGLVLALAAGCTSGTAEKPATPQPGAALPAPAQTAVQPGAQPTVRSTDLPLPTQTPMPTAEDEEMLTLEDRAATLKHLSSYRVQWQGQWKATDDKDSTEVKWEWSQDYTADPEALHMRLRSTDLTNAERTSAMEIWRIGNTTYLLNTQGADEPQCVSLSSEDEDPIEQSMYSPGALGRVEGARYVGAETVNGIRTKHYVYDRTAVTLLTADKVSGELWMAVDGGYVVKETLVWEGGASFFGAPTDAKGQGAWTWQLLDVNPELTITPPEGCESAASTLPMLPDASEKSQFGDMLTYKTSSSLADVAKFYQGEMTKAGWTAAGEAQVTEQFGMLGFTRDDQNVQIMLSPEGGKTNVVIMLQK